MNVFSKFSGIAALLGVLMLPSMANAEGFALQDWSARGAALAGGLVARGGDASAVAFNPAAITELEGTQIMVGIEVVVPYNTIEYSIDGGSTYHRQNASNQAFFIPHGYVTHKLNDNFSLGLGMFSRFGLGNKYPSDWAGSANVTYVNLLTSTVNPVIAYRVNDMLSLAAGVEISGAMVDLKQNNQEFALSSRLKNKGIEYGFGFNLAAHVRFNEQWSAGLTYRSGVDYSFDGELSATSPFFPMLGHSSTNYISDGATTLSLPQEIKLAVAYAPTDKLSFEAGVGYYGWSSYKDLDLTIDNPLPPFFNSYIANPKEWRDTWMFGFSAEYQLYDWLALRAGIAYETSPIPESHIEYMAPSNGRFKYSVGVGIQEVDAWAFDFAYIFHHLNDANFDESAAHNTPGILPGKSDNVYAHSLMMSISYKF